MAPKRSRSVNESTTHDRDSVLAKRSRAANDDLQLDVRRLYHGHSYPLTASLRIRITPHSQGSAFVVRDRDDELVCQGRFEWFAHSAASCWQNNRFFVFGNFFAGLYELVLDKNAAHVRELRRWRIHAFDRFATWRELFVSVRLADDDDLDAQVSRLRCSFVRGVGETVVSSEMTALNEDRFTAIAPTRHGVLVQRRIETPIPGRENSEISTVVHDVTEYRPFARETRVYRLEWPVWFIGMAVSPRGDYAAYVDDDQRLFVYYIGERTASLVFWTYHCVCTSRVFFVDDWTIVVGGRAEMRQYSVLAAERAAVDVLLGASKKSFLPSDVVERCVAPFLLPHAADDQASRERRAVDATQRKSAVEV